MLTKSSKKRPPLSCGHLPLYGESHPDGSPLPIEGEGLGERVCLPTAYLPPISWFVQLTLGEPCMIEQYEHFHKQTFRNRCTIDSPNGRLNLTVPIDKSNFLPGAKCLMKDVRISYHQDWQHQHWNALESSYYNSPFFEYLQDDFRPIYQKHWEYLMDLNEALIQKCCELIDIQPILRRTTDFVSLPPEPPSPLFHSKKEGYQQVFSHKHGFLADLSIIDLIFNLGPESILYLTR